MFAFNAAQIEYLDGDVFVGVFVDGFVDLSEGALADLFEESVLLDADVFKVFFEEEVVFVGEVEGLVPGLDLFVGED